MTSDGTKHESKSVHAVRGTEARAIKKWEQQGWEVVDQKPGRMQTEILLRRTRPKFPWVRAAFIAGIALVLIIVLVVMSILEDDTASEESASESQTSTESVVTNETSPVEATAEADTKATSAPSPEPGSAVITVENNSDFATIVEATDYCSDQVAAFASEHKGQKLHFDGSIGALGPHGDYGTRYDILISAGDFSETEAPGPAFQFRDVNMHELNLTGDDIPDTLAAGDNLTITATVEEYLPEQCLFLLDPVETTMR